MLNLHKLPKLKDSVSYLYLEYGRLEQDAKSVAFFDSDGGKVQIPAAGLCVILLGPGTVVTHAAIKVCAENGCLLGWTGEESVRYYASGFGETRKSTRLIRQALLVSHPKTHLAVVHRMYEMRFGEKIEAGLSLKQIRGREGRRVRSAYEAASKQTGVPWYGRKYDAKNWGAGDPVNRALSAANACLYGVCHAAIVSLGYAAGLGFVHRGRHLSFVYDIADLYKTEISIPIAFNTAKSGDDKIGRRSRQSCRDAFRETKLLYRIVEDIAELFKDDEDLSAKFDVDSDEWVVSGLWDPDKGIVDGGKSW